MSEAQKKKNISKTNKKNAKSYSLQTSNKTKNKTTKKPQIKIAQKAKTKRNNVKIEKKELFIDSNDDLLNSIEIKTIEKKEDIELKNEPVIVGTKEELKKNKAKDTKSKKTTKVKTALPRPVKKETKIEEKNVEVKQEEPKQEEPKQDNATNIETKKTQKKDTKSKKTTKVKSALPRPVKKENKPKTTDEKHQEKIEEENKKNVEITAIDVESKEIKENAEEAKEKTEEPKENIAQITQDEIKEKETPTEEVENELSKTTAMKIKTKFKKAIYEEIEDEKYKKEQKNKKKKFKYYFPIIVGIVVIIALVFLIIYKYDENYRNSLRKYKIYSMGEKVILKDDSEWNVIEYSGERDDKVLILRSQNLDMNNDGAFGNEDKLPISKTSVNYTIEEEGTVGYFLENEYKGKLANQVGKIYEIRLLTSKEYIKIRNTSGFGYEWTNGNWLANNSIKGWWLGDSKGDYSICVAEKGSYVLRKPGRGQYIRPVILISKDDIKNV